MVVQYMLPVTVQRKRDAGTGAVLAGQFDIAWDEEALLAPKTTATQRNVSHSRIKFLGVPPLEDVAEGEQEALVRALEPYRCVPVFLPPDKRKLFYDGYCRDTLWPIFHNVIDVYGELPTRWWVKSRQVSRWAAYKTANQAFSNAIVESFHDGDLVWVHDYHLLLVPMLLARSHIPTVGLFLHIPFPSSEIFRSLSTREDVLRGMLHADHIGFHLFEYARHFLTSCRRILGLTHTAARGGALTVDYQGREVVVTVTHVGVEPAFLREKFASVPAVTEGALAWRARFPGASLVGGVDSVEKLKGVPLKLLAWEAFLASHPASVGRVVLVQLCLDDVVRPGDTQDSSRAEIQLMADRINARFGGGDRVPPVYLRFVHSACLPVEERLALWAASDVLLTSAIRDGLNLLPFEYVYARGSGECIPAGLTALRRARAAAATRAAAAAAARAAATTAAAASPMGAIGGGGGRTSPDFLLLDPFAPRSTSEHGDDAATRDRHGGVVAEAGDGGMEEAAAAAAEEAALALASPGVLVVSEFSGCSRVLSGSMRVNPWRVEEVVSALSHALTMTAEEATARAAANLQYVVGNTTWAWAERVLVDLKGVAKHARPRTYMGVGLGLQYRLLGFNPAFKPLSFDDVASAYRRATRRLIVCDYGGTLNVRDSSATRKHAFELGLLGKDAAPPLTAEIKRALKVVSEDADNTVFIISGKAREVLQQAFAALPCVGLAAEHGFYYRWGAPPPVRGHRGAAAAGSVGSTAGTGGAGGAGGLRAVGSGVSIASGGSGGGVHHPASSPVGGAPAPPPTPLVFSASGGGGGSSVVHTVGDNGIPWQTLGPTTFQDEWKALASAIMESYVQRTNGSYVLVKGSALGWFYGDADAEFGSLQAKELQVRCWVVG